MEPGSPPPGFTAHWLELVADKHVKARATSDVHEIDQPKVLKLQNVQHISTKTYHTNKPIKKQNVYKKIHYLVELM